MNFHNGAMNVGRLSKLLFYFVQIGYAVFVFHVWPLQGWGFGQGSSACLAWSHEQKHKQLGSGGRRCSHKFQRSVTNTLPCWRSKPKWQRIWRDPPWSAMFLFHQVVGFTGSNVMPNLSKFDVFDSTNSGFSIYVNSLEGDQILEWQLAAHGLITLLAWVKLVTQNQPFVGRYGPLVPQWLNPRSQVSNTYPTWSINIIVWLWNYYIIYII